MEYLSLIARDMRETRRMEAKLRQGQDDLELRVAERTAELHRSEALYRTLAEAAPDIVFVLARDGRVEYLNSVAADQFKRPVDEIVRHFVTELFPTNAAWEQLNGVLSVFKPASPMLPKTRFFLRMPNAGSILSWYPSETRTGRWSGAGRLAGCDIPPRD